MFSSFSLSLPLSLFLSHSFCLFPTHRLSRNREHVKVTTSRSCDTPSPYSLSLLQQYQEKRACFLGERTAVHAQPPANIPEDGGGSRKNNKSSFSAAETSAGRQAAATRARVPELSALYCAAVASPISLNKLLLRYRKKHQYMCTCTCTCV